MTEQSKSSVYFDVTEHSQLLNEGGKSQSQVSTTQTQKPTYDPIPVPSIAEIVESPWAEISTSGVGTNTILPSITQGYLNFGVHSVGTPSLPLSETETTTLRDDETNSVLDGSYIGHFRAQSSLPKKWLNDVDIEPYMRMPGAAGSKRSKKDGKKTFFKEPLLEELLPTSRKETLFPAISGPVTNKDKLAAYIFLIMFGLMVFVGALLSLVYPAELRDNFIRSSTILRAIVDSSWILLASVGICCVVSLAWLILIRCFTARTVHLMIYFAPAASFVCGLWASVEFLHGDPGGGPWLLLGAITGLAASALLATFLVSHSKVINQTIEIIKVSADVLSANPSINVCKKKRNQVATNTKYAKSRAAEAT